jgi:hypothetical protein
VIAIAVPIAMGCGEPAEAPANVTPKVTVAGDIPCAPNAVLRTVCQRCHTSPPTNGAPFPLVTYSDIHTEIDGRPIWFWMEKVVRMGDMPLPPVEIAARDRDTILDWVRRGAPSGDPSCVGEASP